MEEKRKKIILWGLGTLLMLSLIVGISYAYWIITKEQTGLNKIGSGCFNIELSNEKNDIKLENAYPIIDEEGRKLVPYSFTVTNTCSLFASYNINLEMLEGTTLNSKYIKVMVNNEEIKNLADLETTNTVLKNSIEARKLTSGSLGAGDSEDYTVRIWMDGSITSSDKEAMNKVMLSKVVVDAEVSKYNPVDNGITLLKDAILANEYQTTDVELAKSKIANKQTVDFSKTAPIIDWEESHANTTSTITATLPDPSLVGSGIAGTENLTETNILPAIGTGYTFNSETGYYTLTGVQRVDPTTLDYTNHDYYFVRVDVIDDVNGNLITKPYYGEYKIFKITGAIKNKTKGTSIVNKTEFDGVAYKMIGNEYTQNEIESDKSDKGLYQMNDEDGLSYYYRGSVNNNYVKFGGYYWRIVRINGDGSIRLLYAGDKPNATGTDLSTTLTDSTLSYSNTQKIYYNTESFNPAYVGYMYGNTLNTSYEETTANANDSTIKKYLDSWYRQNIEEKGYSSYIADSGFCNDRSLSGESVGNGVTIDKSTIYAGAQRLNEKRPSLICPNQNDLFTTSSSTKGNKALTYPIGLLTLDEAMLSGYVEKTMNQMAYIHGNAYWFLTPSEYDFGYSSARVYGMGNTGLATGLRVDDVPKGIRPIINLKLDTEISGGIGTSNEPFIIK